MNAAALASLIAILIATGATARERAFRPAVLPPSPSVGTTTLCAFKAPQLSGYKTRAGERKICYYDCGGSPTAVVIRSNKWCSKDQFVLNPRGALTAPSLIRSARANHYGQ